MCDTTKTQQQKIKSRVWLKLVVKTYMMWNYPLPTRSQWRSRSSGDVIGLPCWTYESCLGIDLWLQSLQLIACHAVIEACQHQWHYQWLQSLLRNWKANWSVNIILYPPTHDTIHNIFRCHERRGPSLHVLMMCRKFREVWICGFFRFVSWQASKCTDTLIGSEVLNDYY